ncbi:MAG: dTDP-4-dehydrorhamnose reductase, partial [Candidatus Nanohaloarchaea archaeon]
MRILVTGINGQLGSSIAEKEEVIGLDLNDAEISADISDEEVIEMITNEDPDCIVHAAAYTDVDGAEENPEKAFEVNVEGTENVVKAAEETGAHLIYISTDYVFDGGKGDYTEEDEPHPLNVYGETKLEGENAVKDSDIAWSILRPSVIFDGKHDNFFTWAKNELETSGEVQVVKDQICSPTLASNLADMVLEVAERGITGTLHTAGRSQVSRYEAVKIMKEELNLEGEVRTADMD